MIHPHHHHHSQKINPPFTGGKGRQLDTTLNCKEERLFPGAGEVSKHAFLRSMPQNTVTTQSTHALFTTNENNVISCFKVKKFGSLQASERLDNWHCQATTSSVVCDLSRRKDKNCKHTILENKKPVTYRWVQWTVFERVQFNGQLCTVNSV